MGLGSCPPLWESSEWGDGGRSEAGVGIYYLSVTAWVKHDGHSRSEEVSSGSSHNNLEAIEQSGISGGRKSLKAFVWEGRFHSIKLSHETSSHSLCPRSIMTSLPRPFGPGSLIECTHVTLNTEEVNQKWQLTAM